MGLYFGISADNSNFIQRLNEIKSGVKAASDVIQNLGRDFDVSTVENKVIALNKVIRDNETVILQLTKQMQKWSLDANEAFNNNNMDTFNVITKDIEEQAQKIAELTAETKQYYDALSMVESSAGVTVSVSAEPTTSPQFFKSQQDYEYAEMLRTKIADLQQQIAGFRGSDEDLQPLRSSLSDLQDKLRGCEMEAAKAASELGGNLGTRAAEASESLYQLNAAVEKQSIVVQSLSIAVKEAASSLEAIQAGGDLSAIDDAQVKYDMLSQSLQNAQMELLNLQAAQTDASLSFQQINNEVEQHDSLMVKMLGGYENYQTIIGQLPSPIQGVIGSINGMTGAAKAFIATPLGAIIAAIVIALQALKTWFDSSVEGQMAFAEISGYVGGVLDQLKEIVITVGKAIYDAFSNPKKAVSDLWKAIKTNIVNRFKAVGDIAIGLGKVIENAFSGKFDEAGKELSALRDKFIQLGTGVENASGKIKNYVKGVNDAAKANARLSKEEKQIEIDASTESIESSKRNKRMQELSAEMYNTSASKAKRKAALAEYKKLSEEQMNADLKLQDRRIALQKERMSLTTNSIEDENKLRELQKQRTDIEAQNASRMAMLQRRSNRIEGSGKTSGPTADQIESKQTEAHQKLIDLMKQQAEERLRLQQDYEYQQWQNRIDLMDEGEAKIIAQMELDHKKEQTSLEEQKKQAIQAEIARQKALFDAREDEKAAGNKKYAKQVFDPTTIYDPNNKVIDPEIQKVIDRYDSLNADLLSKQKKAEADRLQSAKESFNAYLQEFGTYQQKREAIATDYDTRIAAAANAGERMMLEAQKNKALSDLDYQQWIDSGEIALAFGDISNLSQQTISRLIEDMEKYRGKVVATFDPEKIEKYEEALNNLRMADVENTFSAFGSMVPEYFTKRLAIQKQINDETQIGLELIQRQNELNIRTEAKKGAIKIQAKSSGYNITDEDLADPNRIQQIADKISVSAANGDLFAAALHSSLLELLKLNGEAAELANATRKWDGNFSHLKETLANLEGEAKFKAIAEAVGNAAGLIGNLAGQASEMADAIGAEGLGEDLGYLGDAMGSVQNIASGFAQGGIVGGIAAAAGEVMNWVTKLAMTGDARHQKNIERIQDRIDALQKSYDRLGESAEKAYSTDASEMIDQQNTLLKQQQILIRQQMAEEEAKKKTDKDKIKEYQEQLEEIDALLAENADKTKEAIIGKDIKSAIDEFVSLYAEAWDDGTDAAQKSMQAVKSIISSALTELLKKNIQPAAQNFYDTLAKAMEDGILTDAELANLDTIKAQMDALAASGEEQYKKIQERYKDLDELREELTDISFDSVRDNFKSLLSDMTSTTEDFTENWTDMIRNALIEGLMDSKYDALLKEWYAEFAEAMKDHKLTDEERERLRQQYQSIIDQGIADRNAINAIVGGGAYSQQASSGEAWGMTQETGEELNGRFTAMVELEATNNVLVSDGNAIAREILVTLRSMSGLSMTLTGNGDNQTLLAIKDMIFLSTGYLEDIAKYSKLLSVISSDVADMKEKVKDI